LVRLPAMTNDFACPTLARPPRRAVPTIRFVTLFMGGVTGKTTRVRFTLEFKLAAVRLIGAGQSIAVTAAILGLPDPTLHNKLKAHREGGLGRPSVELVAPEQMELAPLRAELVKIKTEPDNVKKPKRTSQSVRLKNAFYARQLSI